RLGLIEPVDDALVAADGEVLASLHPGKELAVLGRGLADGGEALVMSIAKGRRPIQEILADRFGGDVRCFGHAPCYRDNSRTCQGPFGILPVSRENSRWA